MSTESRFDPTGKVAVVTGGSRGIGRAIVQGFVPRQRIGRPGEIVGAALYLASAASSFTTGATIRVDGAVTRRVGG